MEFVDKDYTFSTEPSAGQFSEVFTIGNNHTHPYPLYTTDDCTGHTLIPPVTIPEYEYVPDVSEFLDRLSPGMTFRAFDMDENERLKKEIEEKDARIAELEERLAYESDRRRQLERSRP